MLLFYLKSATFDYISIYHKKIVIQYEFSIENLRFKKNCDLKEGY